MNETFIENFLALAAIPRKSRHEEAVSRYLYERAISRGLTARRDEHNNVIIDRPAAPGFENAPLTILQAHMDMVCVPRPGSGWDPLTSPVTVINDGESLTAKDSSLGGDDGAGVALIQELLEDPSLRCGALRGILTSDEESGMTGAEGLDAAELSGKYMINLDWEEAGSLCCSSAGSRLYHFEFRPSFSAAEGAAFSLTLRGLLGGHSGTMIHMGHGNALRTVAAMLREAAANGVDVRIASFVSGTATNAIPAAATAVFVIPAGQEDALRAAVDSVYDRFCEEFGALEENAQLELFDAEMPSSAMSAADTAALLRFLTGCTHGVHSMSATYASLVESSANLALIDCGSERTWCEIYQRSSDPDRAAEIAAINTRLAAECGAEVSAERESPAWPVKPGSRLVELCTETYRSLTGEEMRVEPVHAGLECGAWCVKAPALDIVSIGPDVWDIHSPAEKLGLASVALLDSLVRAMLDAIARE